MKCINFDEHFADYTSKWMKEHGKEYRNDDGSEQLQVVRVELKPQDDDHDKVVNNTAEQDERKTDIELAALAEDSVAQHLADDDGGKTDDDSTSAHVDIGKALVLSHETARQGDHAV